MNGNPLTGFTGAPITATDDSDSGAEPSDTNPSAPGDSGTTDDPTPLYIPNIGTSMLSLLSFGRTPVQLRLITSI